MLNIINNLKPFCEDCYRRINVREYARIVDISPPTASKLLSEYCKLGLLVEEKDKNYIFYYANKSNKNFIDLSRIYWRHRLSEVIEHLDGKLIDPLVILFGSLAKAEVKADSDIDLCVISHKKDLNLGNLEKKLKRKIQVFFFGSIREINNLELRNNILNGYILSGRIK